MNLLPGGSDKVAGRELPLKIQLFVDLIDHIPLGSEKNAEKKLAYQAKFKR